MGASGSKQSSSSKPLTGKERKDIFDYGTDSVMEALKGFAFPQYQGLGGGDFNRLEKSITDSRTAPLKAFEVDERKRVDQNLADRGLWASGLTEQAQGDVTKSLAPQYAGAGADAATQRYALEAQQRDVEFQNKWAPLNYLSGIWNGTGGVVSNSKGNSWGLNIL